MNKPVKLSIQSARNYVLQSQFLDGAERNPDPLQIVNQLGYVQIDTISVVNRSHHHTLWARQNSYDESMLHDLQAIDRSVFEYWGHAMSYLPMSDYRFALPRMKNLENPQSVWFVRQYEKCKNLIEPVLERIQKEGPLSSKDFEATGKKSAFWWDWKPAKCALEMLFWQGRLMITDRRKFQKVYDLRERVLPDHIDTTYPSEEEAGHFLVRRALRAMGVASEKEILRFLQPEAGRDADLRIAPKEIVRKSLAELAENDEILAVELDHDSKTQNYAHSDVPEKSDHKPEHSKVFILSPFDNLVIQRDRLKRLFDFDYTLECYVPAAKRKFGYFVCPVLFGNQFAGRLDPKADRKRKRLMIQNLMFEPDIDVKGILLPKLAEKLVKMARFNDCEYIELKQVTPEKLKSSLESEIRNAF